MADFSHSKYVLTMYVLIPEMTTRKRRAPSYNKNSAIGGWGREKPATITNRNCSIVSNTRTHCPVREADTRTATSKLHVAAQENRPCTLTQRAQELWKKGNTLYFVLRTPQI